MFATSTIRAEIDRACREHDELMARARDEAATKPQPAPSHEPDDDDVCRWDAMTDVLGEVVATERRSHRAELETATMSLRDEISELRAELMKMQGTIDAFAMILRVPTPRNEEHGSKSVVDLPRFVRSR
jgi:hypothetical protein